MVAVIVADTCGSHGCYGANLRESWLPQFLPPCTTIANSLERNAGEEVPHLPKSRMVASGGELHHLGIEGGNIVRCAVHLSLARTTAEAWLPCCRKQLRKFRRCDLSLSPAETVPRRQGQGQIVARNIAWNQGRPDFEMPATGKKAVSSKGREPSCAAQKRRQCVRLKTPAILDRGGEIRHLLTPASAGSRSATEIIPMNFFDAPVAASREQVCESHTCRPPRYERRPARSWLWPLAARRCVTCTSAGFGCARVVPRESWLPHYGNRRQVRWSN